MLPAPGQSPPPAPRERMLTVREVASALRVSTATVYKLCASGELAHVRVLNVIRVVASALQVFEDDRVGSR